MFFFQKTPMLLRKLYVARLPPESEIGIVIYHMEQATQQVW